MTWVWSLSGHKKTIFNFFAALVLAGSSSVLLVKQNPPVSLTIVAAEDIWYKIHIYGAETHIDARVVLQGRKNGAKIVRLPSFFWWKNVLLWGYQTYSQET